MTLPIAVLLGIIALAVILFSIEYFPVDVVALTVLLLVILTGLLPHKRPLPALAAEPAL